MKLTKINKIKKFGVFDNFVWKNEVENFSKFNIFYGWNYSGKTTLSRIFRCFEVKSHHCDYLNSKFEIEDEANGIHSESSLHSIGLAVRVFNNDYVIDNLKWYAVDGEIEPILLLGQESIELTNKLEIEKKKLEEIQLQKENLIKDKDLKIAEMNKSLTNKAKEIKENLVLTNFTKTHFEPLVEGYITKVNSEFTEFTSEKITQLKAIYQNTEKKNVLASISVSKPNFEAINKTVADLLNKSVKSKVIEKLKNNSNLNNWVKTGKAIHSDKKNCEFCGNDLPSDLIQRLNEHFSTEYEELIQNIDSQVSLIQRQTITSNLPDSANLYHELQGDFSTLTSDFKSELEEINNYLKNICDKLKKKKQKAFEEVESENLKFDFNKLDEIIVNLNNLITKHNLKSNNFESEKTKAKNDLINHYACKFFSENDFAKYKDDLVSIDSRVSSLADEILDINFNIIEYEKKLSDSIKGAEKINEYLSQYFGKNDIKVEVNSGEKFQLTRAGQVAKNLSEGEKTAIAFAYFIASLEGKDTNLSETIVFIDDPISSLDTNHLFNTYSFIKNKFYEFDGTDTTGNKHKCKAAQLFISTHNFEFFSLVKDWLKDFKNRDKSFYFIEKQTNSTISESIIKQLPTELLKFKSEYVFLFSIIYEFHTSTSSDFRFLYNLPNIVRRFIESFCGFKYLSTINIEENLDLLLTDNIKRERVRKFVHYYSHSFKTNTVMGLPNPVESREVVKIVIESLESNDLQHYKSLLAQVTSV